MAAKNSPLVHTADWMNPTPGEQQASSRHGNAWVREWSLSAHASTQKAQAEAEKRETDIRAEAAGSRPAQQRSAAVAAMKRPAADEVVESDAAMKRPVSADPRPEPAMKRPAAAAGPNRSALPLTTTTIIPKNPPPDTKTFAGNAKPKNPSLALARDAAQTYWKHWKCSRCEKFLACDKLGTQQQIWKRVKEAVEDATPTLPTRDPEKKVAVVYLAFNECRVSLDDCGQNSELHVQVHQKFDKDMFANQ